MSRVQIAIYEHASPHVLSYLQSFAWGLMRHGQAFEFVPKTSSRLVDCDVAVFWAHKRGDIIAKQKKDGRRYLVLERGYIGDRQKWISAGYDGLNGRADFCNSSSHGSRFAMNFREYIRPWRCCGQYILIIGQCRNDEALRGIQMEATLEAAVTVLRRLSPLPILFRPHPSDAAVPPPEGTSILQGSLESALSGAHVVVTISSNVGVDAILGGTPAIALDRGSMVWSMAGHSAEDVVNPLRPDREQWAADIAWCQWTEVEMIKGETWAHLKRGV